MPANTSGWQIWKREEGDAWRFQKTVPFALTMHNTYEGSDIITESIIGLASKEDTIDWFKKTVGQEFKKACEIELSQDKEIVYKGGGRVGYSFVNYYEDNGTMFTLAVEKKDGVGEPKDE